MVLLTRRDLLVVPEVDAARDDDNDTNMLGNFMAAAASHSIVVLN
jgi:hypothetical protein